MTFQARWGTGKRMQVHRFQSPFKHWVSGLFAEIAAFGGFIALVCIVTAAIVWLR